MMLLQFHFTRKKGLFRTGEPLMPEVQGFLLGKNATLVCMGDSITEAPDGYVSIVRNLIAAGYPERNIKVINAGVSGDRIVEMLARLNRDVLAHNPSVVTVSVGINDVWHGVRDFIRGVEIPDGNGPDGVPLEIFEAMVGQLVDTLREATDAEIVLLPPTVIGEDVDNPENLANAKLKGYVAAMRRVAESRQVYVASTHEDFVQTLRAGRSVNPDFCLTTDGVHMNSVGNHVLALSVLAALGYAGLAG
jgi:lysophospholipase L1-like esterase